MDESRKIVNVEISDVLVDNMANRYAGTTFDRAIPSNADGLIEVSRKVLYTIFVEKFYGGKEVKSAQIVGSLIADYHPHGDQSAYGSIVELTQWFSTNYPYLSTESNFGNILGDPEAAPRYTDAKGSKFAEDIIFSLITDESIDYTLNFNRSKKEPMYLPSKLPLLLINGKPSGIAIGFATNIPPHNLEDVCNMCIKYIQNPNIPNHELVDGVFPDYPTGGVIVNGEAVEKYYKYGEPASIKLKALTRIDREKNIIEVLNLPYKVYWNNINKRIIELVDSKNGKPNPILSKIVSMFPGRNKNATDDHEKNIFRLQVSKDANVLEVEEHLLRSTQLLSSQPLKFLLNYGNGVVRDVNIKTIIKDWYEVRVDVFKRMHISKKNSLEVENHKLEGLLFIFPKMDEVISFIRRQKDKESIVEGLYNKFKLTKSQALAISEMRIYQLTSTSKEKLEEDLKRNKENIKEIEWKLSHIDELLIQEIEGLREKYKRPRRTIVLRESENETSLNIASGAILYSRSSIGIFDLVNLFNSKTITNGLKVVKVDGKNVRGIIGTVEITDSLEGIVVIQENGVSKKYLLDDIKHLNSWLEICTDSFIKAVLPIYKNNNEQEALIVSDNNNLRRVKLSEFSTNKKSIGKINTACLLNPEDRYLMLMDEESKYVLVSDWLEDIPLLSIKAGGVKTSFQSPIKFAMTVPKSENIRIITSIHDIIEAEKPFSLQISHIDSLLNDGSRTRKPRHLIYKFNPSTNKIGFNGIINMDKKNSIILFINHDNTVKLDIKHFRNENRNISYFIKGALQVERV